MRRRIVFRVLVTLTALSLVAVAGAASLIRAGATSRYGPPNDGLNLVDRWRYSARLLSYGALLDQARDPNGMPTKFRIDQGEAVASIASRLEGESIISSGRALQDYLVYTGKDRTIQAGEYSVSAASSPLEIAAQLQDATPADVTFVVLPGWRVEEIAAALPTSGLEFTQLDLLAAVLESPTGLEFLPAQIDSREGLLSPGAHVLPRSTTAAQFVETLTARFVEGLRPELRSGFESQGLSVYEAVILASIIQREAVQESEQSLIASVFLNRLRTGMNLDSDPTVQYALGYNVSQGSWWTNPLSAADLEVASPYNTYLNAGLPPAPICNPGIDALEAVARPAAADYYYFRARCDGSGLHAFSRSFDEHVQNACR